MPLRRPSHTKGASRWEVVTAAGPVRLSPYAKRLACLAATSWSFDVAANRLDELAGVRLDSETLRRHTEAAASGRPRRLGGAEAWPVPEAGAVEGLAHRTGRWLECCGRGWDEGHVTPMAALVCAVQTDEWDTLWPQAA